LKHLKLFVVSHGKSEFGVESMRFEADAAVPGLVRQVPHVDFEVAYLASELAGREILIPPNSPSDGVRVAWILRRRKCAAVTPSFLPPECPQRSASLAPLI
jgi:hypothetical protein